MDRVIYLLVNLNSINLKCVNRVEFRSYIGDIHYFMEELEKGAINEVRKALKKEFQTLQSTIFQEWEIKPYDVVHDGVSGVAVCIYRNVSILP